MHRGLVGEAGTEVGITKSALRELSSAGIPGYQLGGRFTARAREVTTREGLGGAPGAVIPRAVREAATQAALTAYQENQNEFLESLWDLERELTGNLEADTAEGHKIALKGQKEFFTKYPAVIDAAFGGAFRQSGPVVEGMYNAAFSGMQAYSRAELGGATKEKAREAMAQHAVAEGLKEGGIIDQGLDGIRTMAAKRSYALEGGVEKQTKILEEAQKETPKLEAAVKAASAKSTYHDSQALAASEKLEKTEADLLAEQQSYNKASKDLQDLKLQNDIYGDTNLIAHSRYNLEEQQKASAKRIEEFQARQATATASFNRLDSAAKTAKKQLTTSESNLDANKKTADNAQGVIDEIKDFSKQSKARQIGMIGILGGIESGLAGAAAVIAAGGSRGDARDAAVRGAAGGLIRDIGATFGTANPQFIQSMSVMGVMLGINPIPSGARRNARQAGRSTDEMIEEAMKRTNTAFQQQGRGQGWTPYAGPNAQGRVYTSPHLAMVGEGSANEVIIPTERIRKGLPINAGVARELGSIGVPGYQKGKGKISGGPRLSGAVEQPSLPKGEPGWMDKFTSGWGSDAGDDFKVIGFREGGKASGGRFGAAGQNLGAKGGDALATGALSFATTLMQGGSFKDAAFQGIGTGVGYGASLALAPFLGPFAPLAGSLIGAGVTGVLNKFFNKPKKPAAPDYSKDRSKVLKVLEHHILSKSPFMFGQPSGITNLINKSMTGPKKDNPSPEELDKLIAGLNESQYISSGFSPGLDAGTLLSLLSGRVKNATQRTQLYRAFNNAYYGTPMAAGGIVTKPTNAVVGEAGPEAVIPLDKFNDYSGIDQKKDNENIITELRKQNQQMQMFIKKIGDAKTVLNVDGRTLAETVGQNMYEMNTGM